MLRLTAETCFRDWGGGCFGPDLNTAALTFDHIPQRFDKMTSPVQVEMCQWEKKKKTLACILFLYNQCRNNASSRGNECKAINLQ